MTSRAQGEQVARKATSGASPGTDETLLAVSGLDVSFPVGPGWARAVADASLEVAEGEILGLVGESGAGKSVTARAIVGLSAGDAPARIGGSIRFKGTELTGLDRREMREVRGAGIGMIFQHPGASLNPVATIGSQLLETLGLDGMATRERSLALLSDVGFSEPEAIAGRYPHQLSGGFQQRAMIALALARRPSLLIADEPTSSLDITAQAHILDLLADLRRRYSMAIVLITHDLGVVARMADRVTVMAAGTTVETGAAVDLLDRPEHPATRRLVAAHEALDGGRPGPGRDPSPTVADRSALIEIENLTMTYPSRSWGRERSQRSADGAALDGVSLELREGEALGLVGESGSGKTTFARCLIRACEPTGGRVSFAGEDITHLPEPGLKSVRRQITMVFQDPSASLNPRQRVAQILEAPLRAGARLGSDRFRHKSERSDRILETLGMVGLEQQLLDRFPAELSGGQRQRIGLARALVTGPRVLICDEPFSSIDTVSQAALIDLLADLRRRLELTCLFIAHDLAVVRRVADRVAVIDDGQIVEVGPTERIFTDPRHAQTRRFIVGRSGGGPRQGVGDHPVK